MIRDGCEEGGWAGYSGMRQSARLPDTAERAVMAASNQTAADKNATHSTWANAKTIMTAIGARMKAPSDNHRRTPRRERKKYAAVRLTAAPPSPTASIARLLSSAKTTRVTTARAANRRLKRASQRWPAVGHLAPDPGVKAGDGRPAKARPIMASAQAW